jgi:sigma-B regulation protein RsbU (phosphoserine phosphatase)
MGKEKKAKVNRMGLRLKFSLIVSFVGICIAVALVLMGTNLMEDTIIHLYTDQGYKVAQTAVDFFTDEEIERYADLADRYIKGEVEREELDAVSQEPRYVEVKQLIRNLRKEMDANDIFICVYDVDMLKNYDQELDEKGEWTPIYYIMDCYHTEEEDFMFGDASAVVLEYLDTLIKSNDAGKRPSEFIVTDTQFGHNTTAILPIIVNDKTIAFCYVETPMKILESNKKMFVTQLGILTAVVTVILLIISIFLIVRLMIRHIVYVAQEADRFTSDNSVITHKLSEIKTHDEIQVLAENLLKLEIGINEYIDNLTKVTAEKERIGAELNVATQIQADMLPRIFPAFPERKEFDLYASMDPAKEVGGDFYDFFLIDDDHIGLVMADVSGKGVPAALFMVIAKTLIKNRAQIGGSPSEVLAYANEQLCEGNDAELFVTVWLGIIQISTGKGLAANAGHEHPVIRRAGGEYELVKYRHSPAVATMEGIKFREHEFELNPGDSLYVYTDGVPEATNSNEEMYGTDRMLAALNRNPDASPEEALKTVKDDISEFVGEAPQFDDITMLGFSYFGK